MFDEFQKSIKAVLYDRLTSPLAGTFALSWLVWNWGLVYYVIIGDETRNVIERIDYIKENFLSVKYILVFPFISVLFLILIYPFIANLAYRVMLMFNKEKRKIKIKIEDEQCLMIKESIEIRNEIRKQTEKYQDFNKQKEEKIKKLEQEIVIYKRNMIKQKDLENKKIEDTQNNIRKIAENDVEKNNLNKEYNKFKNTKFFPKYRIVTDTVIRGRGSIFDIASADAVAYFVSLQLIKPISDTSNRYKLTEKGKYFLKKDYEKS